jgi:hypothetical protein
LHPLLDILLTLAALGLAAAAPFLLQHPRTASLFSRLRPRSRPEPGFTALAPGLEPGAGARLPVLRAILLVGLVLTSTLALGDPAPVAGRLVSPVAAFLGLAFGLTLLGVMRLRRRCVNLERGMACMQETGIDGTWVGTEAAPLGFSSRLIEALGASNGCSLITPSGLSAFAALSHPAREPLSAPHPSLAGKSIRLLVLPPRSGRTDPARRRRSCAEEALTRSGVTPEQHWSRLQQALEVQQRWIEEYGCDVQVRFLEGRPVHAVVVAAEQGWFRPWFGPAEVWTAVSARPRGRDLHTCLVDQFESAWQEGAEELSVAVRPDGTTAVIGTGSVALPATPGAL